MSDSIANGGCCSGSIRPGTYGDATDVAQITVDKCGRITKISNVAISGGGGSSQWTGTTGNPIYYVPNVGIGSSATPTAKLQVTGNVYVSNAITTTNVFATRYYGDGGLLSNISTFTQPLANLVVSNSVTTNNIYVANTFQVDNTFFANTTTVDMNFNTLTITYINTSNIVVSNLIASTGNIYMYGNVYVSNSLTSENVFATRYYGDGGLLSNISSAAITQPFANLVVSNSVTTANVHVTDTLDVLGAMTANAANATFFFDTFTIPYINTQELNVSSVMNFTGPLATISNLYVPGNANIEYLSVSNLSVTGNLYITATNVQTTNALTINNSGTMTALKVTQNETSIHTHNVAEFWDATTLAMVIDPEGNVAIHTTSSPGYALTVTGPANFETLYIRGNDALTTLNVNGNVFVSNAVTATNVFATTVSATNVIGTHYGQLVGSNTVSASTQTLSGTAGATTLNITGNLFVSNAVTTTNIFTTGNVAVGDLLTVGGLAGYTSLNVTGNLFVSNAVTATNVFATTVSATNVIGTHYGPLLGSNTVSASTQTLSGTAGATTLNITGNLFVSNGVTTTNIFTTGNVAVGDLLTVGGLAGYTSLNVTGNVFVSNAVTTTNVYLRSGVTNSTAGQIVKGALEFNGTSNIFYGTSSTIRGLIPVQYFYQLNADTALGTTASATPVPAFPGIVNGVQLENGKYYMKMLHVLTLTTSSTAGNTSLQMAWNGGASVTSGTLGIFTYNVTSTTSIGNPITVTTSTIQYFTGVASDRVSSVTTATSTATTYYTTIEGTFTISTGGGWYPVANVISPGTFTATPGVRRASFIYVEKIGDTGVDVNIGGWS